MFDNSCAASGTCDAENNNKKKTAQAVYRATPSKTFDLEYD